MTPEEFIKKYYGPAVVAAGKKGFDPLIVLTAAAQESAWGAKAVGNNFFGIKDTDGINGNEQLITTTEYSTRANLKFPVILSIIRSGKFWKYKIKDWFRKYPTPEESFADYMAFFERNPRYRTALQYRRNPVRFFEEIARAGYATDPKYATNLKNVLKSVIRRLPKN